MPTPDAQRLDLWLYYARLAKTRSLCSRFIQLGHVRINGQRTDKAHARIRTGDILTFVPPHKPHEVYVWRIKKLGERRGPASEAAYLYETIVERNDNRLATPPSSSAYQC
ncbi:RNA-binding S4 domain-containing protein [Saccharibacter sp. 17.LH.SD]|uniref:RNA-binding S4 domain-containing protein n=1 Tax=Saccharibacter sp. 17.LH.SD TaxID=2689393 RepID=UPI001367F46F|nr:RNA-binding S4 domain-containing protein [Saccharibacter sp. 17.LH.SD]MXV44175.1 RNA-binding S4 domain-containing protein [Saccharibacter sp. 17.LH.SD]